VSPPWPRCASRRWAFVIETAISQTRTGAVPTWLNPCSSQPIFREARAAHSLYRITSHHPQPSYSILQWPTSCVPDRRGACSNPRENRRGSLGLMISSVRGRPHAHPQTNPSGGSRPHLEPILQPHIRRRHVDTGVHDSRAVFIGRVFRNRRRLIRGGSITPTKGEGVGPLNQCGSSCPPRFASTRSLSNVGTGTRRVRK